MGKQELNYLKDKITEAELHQTCDLIRENIAKDNVKEAFEETKSLIKKISDPVNLRRMILLENRYTNYNEIKDLEIRKPEELALLKNKILYDFLGFISEINLNRTLRLNQENIENIQLQVQKLEAKLSLNVKITKERISKLGECWGAIYSFENRFFKEVDSFIEDYINFSESSEKIMALKNNFQQNRNLDNLNSLLKTPEIKKFYSPKGLERKIHIAHLKGLKKVFKIYKKADSILEKNRFWLGEEIYKEARKYHDCYPRFYEKFKNMDYSGCLECFESQREIAISIEDIVAKLQEKFF